MKTALGLIQLQDLSPACTEPRVILCPRQERPGISHQPKRPEGIARSRIWPQLQKCNGKGKEGTHCLIQSPAGLHKMPVLKHTHCREMGPGGHTMRMRCLSLVCGELGAGAPQTWAASASNSIPTLAAGTQGTVKWIPTLGLRHCREVPLVTGSPVTHLLFSV